MLNIIFNITFNMLINIIINLVFKIVRRTSNCGGSYLVYQNNLFKHQQPTFIGNRSNC